MLRRSYFEYYVGTCTISDAEDSQEDFFTFSHLLFHLLTKEAKDEKCPHRSFHWPGVLGYQKALSAEFTKR